MSSTINEAIREVLNFSFIYLFIYFYEKILYSPKARKSTKKHKKHREAPTAQKALKAQKRN